MHVDEVMAELKSYGSPQTVKIYHKHGATQGEMFGVKVGDLKKIQKKIKGDQELAYSLWDTGNSDAMYLASLVADGRLMTRRKLDDWAKSAWWYMLSEYAVPFVAAEHADAFRVAFKWIAAKANNLQTSGWSSYANALSTHDDAELDLGEIQELLSRVEEDIDGASGRVRYSMNGFVISVGCYVHPLLAKAKTTAKRIGTIKVEMGETACKVPRASETIRKIESMGRVGKKRKSAKC